MKKYATPMTLLALVLLFGCESSQPETLVDSGYDEAEMDAAIERARNEVDAFLDELANPTGSKHGVKAPVKDGEKVEHFWLTNIKYSDGKFTGLIGNEPGVVGNVKMGQKWTLAKTEISDWMYMKNEKIHGNFTMRPLLKTMPEAEANMYRSMLAEP